MKIVIIDGQGGRIGRTIIEQLKEKHGNLELYAIGTNSIATSAMLKAGADYGATGENAVIVNAADSDIIIGPIGIVFANALLGEITPAIATAIGASKATSGIVLPLSHLFTAGVVTPRIVAISSCVIPIANLRFLILIPTVFSIFLSISGAQTETDKIKESAKRIPIRPVATCHLALFPFCRLLIVLC